MTHKYLYHAMALWCLFLVLGCSTQKALSEHPQVNAIQEEEKKQPIEEEIYTPKEDIMAEDYTEHRTLDELVVTASRGYVLPRYNAAADRIWDLIHMDLDIRFDWVNEHVIGRAALRLNPYFYAQDHLVLDAKGFEILDISDPQGRSLAYDYDGEKIRVTLNDTYDRNDELLITVDYIAKPSEGPIGGSAAITSDKGLFFINPRGEEPNKPQQIWTQGETENNSRWFPTIDKPNENMTHDITITVDERFVTLSNGTLISSKSHSNNSRTDHWKMETPHAPYLTMIAVGEFAVTKEEVDGLPLEYYVEKEYEPYAKQIFAHTPEMIRFFSDILDYPFPWKKFSQIITRDYVSGAMENTTAVIYGDFIQKTDRELIDDGNDYIIAHEMFHHWFGDLVTCESWANLTLQEGFANYSEYLWQEYKYGLDAAGFQRNNEKQGYLASIMQSGIHPLIHYGYGDKEEMFDGHSYNKGGLVLHMLRKQIGDEAFYAALNLYLTRHRHTAVEVDELRMAFEDVSGLDLQWFFDQWYMSAGHPVLEVSHNYDTTTQSLIVKIDQNQDPETSPPIFILPTTISVYDGMGTETRYDVTVDERNDEIVLSYDQEPTLVVFDREDHLLKVLTESKTTQEYINQYKWVDTYIHRFAAINKVKTKKEANAILIAALDDNHHTIRKIAVEQVRLSGREDLVARLRDMAKSDKHSSVRGAAIKRLGSVEGVDIARLIQETLTQESSYKVIADALETLKRVDTETALAEAIKLKPEKTSLLTGAVSSILAESGDISHLPYFEERLTSVSLFSVFNFYDSYYDLLSQLDVQTIVQKASRLKEMASSPVENIFYKFTSTNMLSKLRNDLRAEYPNVSQRLGVMIEEIKAGETNELLLQRYGAF